MEHFSHCNSLGTMSNNLPSVLVSIKDGVIDLGWGHPSSRLHPVGAIRAASERLLVSDDSEPLQYGATQGFGPFLESLASFLSRQPAYGVPVDPHNLFLTAGASQGLDLACTLYAPAGSTVVVEEPTYFVIEKIFRDRDLNIIGVPTDSQGMLVAELEKLLFDGLDLNLVYTIPTFQNPTGFCLSDERRTQLVHLANKFDFHILADEVYQLIHFDELPPKPLIAFDQGSRVISFGSFSKILAPGLRTGWIHAAPEIIERFSDASLTFSGGGFNHYASALIRKVIDLGLLDPHVSVLREEYSMRSDAMDQALRHYFGSEIEYTPPTGGYYFWLTFPENFDSGRLLASAENAGVSYRPGNAFSESGKFSRQVRLAYTLFEVDELKEGVSRLYGAYKDFDTAKNSSRLF